MRHEACDAAVSGVKRVSVNLERSEQALERLVILVVDLDVTLPVAILEAHLAGVERGGERLGDGADGLIIPDARRWGVERTRGR